VDPYTGLSRPQRKIEDIVNKRHALLGAFLNLNQPKGKPAFIIERRNDLADDGAWPGGWRYARRMVL
jgi:hypothetical protein